MREAGYNGLFSIFGGLMDESNGGTPLTYASSVGYQGLDAYKRACLEAVLRTLNNPNRLGFFVEEWSIGESATAYHTDNNAGAGVIEGLGTKNIVADARFEAGVNHWGAIARDTLAMVVNDIASIGALPALVFQNLDVESDIWFKKRPRWLAFIAGWEQACHDVGCAWGGGETPGLRDLVMPGRVIISGSGIGTFRDSTHRIMSSAILCGDTVVGIGSSGIHANGVSLPRRDIEPKLDDGFRTIIDGSTSLTFGDSMLVPTFLYTRLIEACQDAGIQIHYAINVTGHGWLKFMRAREPFRYVLHHVPVPIALFDFIREKGPVELKEMYKTFNMGVGYALIVAPRDAAKVIEIALKLGFPAWEMGHVEPGPKSVRIEPLDITFDAAELDIR